MHVYFMYIYHHKIIFQVECNALQYPGRFSLHDEIMNIFSFSYALKYVLIFFFTMHMNAIYYLRGVNSAY